MNELLKRFGESRVEYDALLRKPGRLLKKSGEGARRTERAKQPPRHHSGGISDARGSEEAGDDAEHHRAGPAPTNAHPIRRIKALADEDLPKLSPIFDAMYSERGGPPIEPEQMLKAGLLIAFFSVRRERAFCERLDYDLM